MARANLGSLFSAASDGGTPHEPVDGPAAGERLALEATAALEATVSGPLTDRQAHTVAIAAQIVLVRDAMRSTITHETAEAASRPARRQRRLRRWRRRAGRSSRGAESPSSRGRSGSRLTPIRPWGSSPCSP